MPSRTLEAQSVVLSLAGEGRAKDRLNRAYRALSKHFTWNRVRDVFYADPRISLRDDEMAELRKAAKLKIADADANDARNEMQSILARLARVEALLLQDPDFYSAQVDPLRASSGGLRRVGRAVDKVEND